MFYTIVTKLKQKHNSVYYNKILTTVLQKHTWAEVDLERNFAS